jgi:outer membrane lipoprotein carrier protein
MTMKIRLIAAAWLLTAGSAQLARADAVDALRAFGRDVHSASADFTQTVIAPDGGRRKESHGHFSFERPDRFRFEYDKPYVQTLVSDGKRLWIHDPDLNQVTVRSVDKALDATPIALLSGAAIDKAFELKTMPASDGLQWVAALPRSAEGSIKQVRVGFEGAALVAMEITDAFGQRSTLRFSKLATNQKPDSAAFRFTPPAGVDLIEQ